MENFVEFEMDYNKLIEKLWKYYQKQNMAKLLGRVEDQCKLILEYVYNLKTNAYEAKMKKRGISASDAQAGLSEITTNYHMMRTKAHTAFKNALNKIEPAVLARMVRKGVAEPNKPLTFEQFKDGYLESLILAVQEVWSAAQRAATKVTSKSTRGAAAQAAGLAPQANLIDEEVAYWGFSFRVQDIDLSAFVRFSVQDEVRVPLRPRAVQAALSTAPKVVAKVVSPFDPTNDEKESLTGQAALLEAKRQRALAAAAAMNPHALIEASEGLYMIVCASVYSHGKRDIWSVTEPIPVSNSGTFTFPVTFGYNPPKGADGKAIPVPPLSDPAFVSKDWLPPAAATKLQSIQFAVYVVRLTGEESSSDFVVAGSLGVCTPQRMLDIVEAGKSGASVRLALNQYVDKVSPHLSGATLIVTPVLTEDEPEDDRKYQRDNMWDERAWAKCKTRLEETLSEAAKETQKKIITSLTAGISTGDDEKDGTTGSSSKSNRKSSSSSSSSSSGRSSRREMTSLETVAQANLRMFATETLDSFKEFLRETELDEEDFGKKHVRLRLCEDANVNILSKDRIDTDIDRRPAKDTLVSPVLLAPSYVKVLDTPGFNVKERSFFSSTPSPTAPSSSSSGSSSSDASSSDAKVLSFEAQLAITPYVTEIIDPTVEAVHDKVNALLGLDKPKPAPQLPAHMLSTRKQNLSNTSTLAGAALLNAPLSSTVALVSSKQAVPPPAPAPAPASAPAPAPEPPKKKSLFGW